MKLRHRSPFHNVESILQAGLDPVYAVTEAETKYVWLHTPQRIPWAIGHTARRKQVAQDGIVILEVSVPRSWLWRAWRGVWKCPDVIRPERIRVLEVSESFKHGEIDEGCGFKTPSRFAVGQILGGVC